MNMMKSTYSVVGTYNVVDIILFKHLPPKTSENPVAIPIPKKNLKEGVID